MGGYLQSYLKDVVFSLCESTLEIIKNEMISFPEFRQAFFKLIQNIIKHCTQGCFQLEADQFNTLILTILFSMKHVKPELMEIGNESMVCLTELLNGEPNYATVFYTNFYIQILHDVIVLLTDSEHVSGFKLQGLILQKMVQAVYR